MWLYICYIGDCIGAQLSSVNRFPVVFVYGLKDITGFIVCKSSESCIYSETEYSKAYVYPNVSNVTFIPRSKLILRREHNGVTTSSLRLIPEIARQHFYVSITEAVLLKPAMPYDCSGVSINIGPSSSLISHTTALMSVIMSNKGKVYLASWCSRWYIMCMYKCIQGGGEVKVMLRCSELIVIDPPSASIEEWIHPV